MKDISVNGVGIATGIPDTLVVTLGVSVLRPTVARATTDAASVAERVITELTRQGIPAHDMATSDYSLSPEYDYSGPTQRLTGFRVQNTIAVKLHDLDANAGAVLDAVTSAGGDDAVVQGVAMSIEDPTVLASQARAAAWADARSKATQLAGLAGVELGDAVSILESSAPSPMPMLFAESAKARGGATPILPGTQDVVVSLQITFAAG